MGSCADVAWMCRYGYMGEEDLLDEGYLLEANRQFFHPLGLQVVAQILDEGLRLRVLDRRGMPAGPLFEREEDEQLAQERSRKILRVGALWETRGSARLKRHGFIVQPPEQLY